MRHKGVTDRAARRTQLPPRTDRQDTLATCRVIAVVVSHQSNGVTAPPSSGEKRMKPSWRAARSSRRRSINQNGRITLSAS
jgi:hypothetical protein